MMVNPNLATFSDWSFNSALAIYLVVLVLHAAEYGFTRNPDRKRERALVAAGGPEVAPEPSTTSTISEGRTLPERLGRTAVALTVLAAVLHAASLLLRGLATQRVPWGNMYEFGSAICLVAVVSWLVVLRKHDVRHIGAFVMLPMMLLLFVAGKLLYVEAAPLMPALRSYWITIHVSAAILASGVFLVSGVASLLYLVRLPHENNPERFATMGPRLPAADALDRLSYRLTVFAFPIFTFGIIAGAIWAESAWGRYWGWDPKETVSFIAWVIYAGYLHARATAGWRGSRSAWVNVLGFVMMVFNLFFVNLVTTGLHSYAGV
ncbi:c-type cytochrome biogenesis protein CcsB [Allokutzneria oryzae]|uniref:C-type cytochrome biogenesis protein CcsB n=1 Tax=Allokutzneria oryzae TaxID=1378989 RepID=A0ABV5ZWE2_9PSEU